MLPKVTTKGNPVPSPISPKTQPQKKKKTKNPRIQGHFFKETILEILIETSIRDR